MKLRTIITSLTAALSLGAAISASAAISYYPPERIHCALKDSKLACEGFNRQYLVEDTYTADLNSEEKSFSFKSGIAYFTPDKSQASMFFTYRDHNHKLVKLKSASPNVRPDLKHGNWIKMDEDLYACKDGYMHCPITTASVTE